MVVLVLILISNLYFVFLSLNPTDSIFEETAKINYEPEALTWWNFKWAYRKNITITNPHGTVNSFPAYLKIQIESEMKFNLADLRFVFDNWQTLSHELEYYNNNFAYVWVNIPTISGYSNTTIQMYYGNNDATLTSNPVATWDSSYRGVWHLSENFTGNRYDSTSYNQHGITSGYNGDEKVNGIVAGADEFDGINDHIYVPDSSSLDVQIFTLETWVYVNSWESRGDLIVSKGMYPNYNYRIAISSYVQNNAFDTMTNIDGELLLTTDTVPAATNEWIYLVSIFNSTTLSLYKNGNLVGTTEAPSGSVLTNGYDLFIGDYVGGNDYAYEGILDEIRLSDVVRSVDWMKFNYDLIMYQDLLVKFSDVEHYSVLYPSNWWDGNWLYRRNLTIYNPGPEIKDYQVLVELNSTSFNYQKFGYAGKDIRFVANYNETVFSHFVELWDVEGTSRVWVKIANLEGFSDTVIQMYYGNNNATSLSSGYSTFEFFSDKDDLANWVTEGDSMHVFIEDDYLHFVKDTDDNWNWAFRDVSPVLNTFIFEDRTKILNPSGASSLFIGGQNTDTGRLWGGFRQRSDNSDGCYYQTPGGFNLLYNGYSHDNFYTSRNIVYQSEEKVDYSFYNDYFIGSPLGEALNKPFIATSPSNMTQIRLDSGGSADFNFDCYISWMRIRKFVSDEPISVFDDEENPLGVSIPAQNDGYSGNDAGNTIESATELSSAGIYYGQLPVGDTNDYYKLYVDKDKFLDITLQTERDDDFELFIYNPLLEQEIEITTTLPNIENILLETQIEGYWIIQINKNLGDGSYSLTITIEDMYPSTNGNLQWLWYLFTGFTVILLIIFLGILYRRKVVGVQTDIEQQLPVGVTDESVSQSITVIEETKPPPKQYETDEFKDYTKKVYVEEIKGYSFGLVDEAKSEETEAPIGVTRVTRRKIEGKMVKVTKTLVVTPSGLKWKIVNSETNETWFEDY